MNPLISHQYLESMAWKIDRHGIDSIPPAALRDLGFEANLAGLNASLSEVLIDPAAPPVVRQRAFGRIATALFHHHVSPSTPNEPSPTITADQVTCAA